MITIRGSIDADIRRTEKTSIRKFVEDAAERGCFNGEVLDFGCGQQPYRDIVEGHGTYHPFDRAGFPASTVGEDVGELATSYKAILCTQVVQYIVNPSAMLLRLERLLEPGGCLVITWPTCWDEIERADKWRYTAEGMRAMLDGAGFIEIEISARAVVQVSGFSFYLGHGAIAWK